MSVDLAERQAEMLCNRVRKNARHLRKWLAREGITCYRLYDRDIPELPICIDWYEGRLRATEHRRNAPEGRTGDEWLRSVMAPVASELGVADSELYLKARERQRGAAQYQARGRADHRIEVGEGGLRFWVNLVDYIDTGLFLDHRPLRARVREEARGARVLNLFSYTAAFSVYVAAGGARSTVSVDLSPTYSAWARDNLELNGMAADNNEVWDCDVALALARLRSEGRRFDLIVVDPPTFSNSSRTDTVFDVQRDHEQLLADVLALVEPGGTVYFSTNARRFRPADILLSERAEALGESTIPMDFRDRKIHRAWRVSG